MIKIIDEHIDILPEAQKAIWDKLPIFSELGFTLYGGTALALQLGHRISIDFDFFSDIPFDNNVIKNKLSDFSIKSYSQDYASTLSFETTSGVRISLFGDMSIGRINSPVVCSSNKLILASCDDLFATKIKAIFDRIEFKDYFDIASLLKNGYSLEKGINDFHILFNESIDTNDVIKALVYFKGGDLIKLKSQEREILKQCVNNFDYSLKFRTIKKESRLGLSDRELNALNIIYDYEQNKIKNKQSKNKSVRSIHL